MKKISIAFALCASLIGGVAIAAPKWDTNGGGTLSPAEKAQKREQMKEKRAEHKQQMLQKFDTNKDGTLDQAERQAMFDQIALERFNRLDTDGNGVLSLAEFKAGKKQFGKHHRGGARRGMMKVR
jgi:Ca2+-binding EF-hand superfamily protein